MTKIKNITMGITLFAALFASAIGMTAFAASSGVLKLEKQAIVCYTSLKNTSSGSRYCSISLYRTAYHDMTNLNYVDSSSKNTAVNGFVSAGGEYSREMRHFMTKGAVYNSQTAASGVAVNYSKVLHIKL